MILKDNVKLLGLSPQILLALFIAAGCTRYIIRVSCGVEGQHREKSKHYIGHAVDLTLVDDGDILRPNTSGAYDFFVRDLKASLSAEFDVVLEATHVHVEWDPKQGV